MIPLIWVLFIVFLTNYHRVKAAFTVDDMSTWFNYNITDLASNEMKNNIHEWSKSYRNDGIFIIHNFLNQELIHVLLNLLLSSDSGRSLKPKTIFQDKGDFKNFPKDSVRNVLQSVSVSVIEGSNAENLNLFHQLYKNDNLLSLLKLITKNQLLSQSSNPFCKDRHTKMFAENNYKYKSCQIASYIMIFDENDHLCWHFDLLPFTCVYIIKQAENGGSFMYVNNMKPIQDNEHQLMDIIKNQNETSVNRILPNAGSMYCFRGKNTLHNVDVVLDETKRIIFATLYDETRKKNHTERQLYNIKMKQGFLKRNKKEL